LANGHGANQSSGSRISAAAGSPARGLFALDGNFWSIDYDGRLIRLKDSKGLCQLAHLLRHPEREFLALDLVELTDPRSEPSTAPQIDFRELSELSVRSDPGANGGELIDAQAKTAYERRIAELREELDDARELSDEERIARLEDEIDLIATELSASLGLRGRSRRAGSAAEQARVNVTKNLGRALDQIEAKHESLGHLLKSTIRTGIFCSYQPDSRFPVAWIFESNGTVENESSPVVPEPGETLPKHVSSPVPDLASEPEAETASPTRGRIGTRGYTLGAALIGAALIASVIAYRLQLERPVHERSQAAQAAKATVAVLPFENLSASKDDEYFSDGVTEEIIANLSKIAGLQVAGRTSSFALKGQNLDVHKAGKMLGVQNLLEGSVRRSAGKVRIAVQLTDTRSGFNLWSETYDEDLTDVFRIQSAVAESVAQGLRIRLVPRVREQLDRPPTRNLGAYDLYLRGRYYFSKALEDGYTKAIDAFSRATEEDPNFALAYSGLGAAYGYAGDFDMPQQVAIPKARTAIERALAIDNNLGEAHGLLADIVFHGYDWNWAGAEREFQRALALDPNNALIHEGYSDFLVHMGRFDEALQQALRAYELDPLSVRMVLGVGWVYRDSRNYPRALEYFQRVIEMAPENPLGYHDRGQVYELTGQLHEAVSDFEKAVALSPVTGAEGSLAVGYGLTGRRSDALTILNRVKEESSHRFVDPITFASIYFALGDRVQGFQWMERAYKEKSYFMTGLRSPLWDLLRSDPRFQAIYQKVGLPK